MAPSGEKGKAFVGKKRRRRFWSPRYLRENLRLRMDPIWRKRFYPEIALFNNKQDRIEAWIRATPIRKARSNLSRRWFDRIFRGPRVVSTIVYYICISGVSWLAIRVIMRIIIGYYGLGIFLGLVILAFLFLCIVNALTDLRSPRLVRRSLRKQLNERGVRLCIPCGYDLQGTPGNRCSECGAIIDTDAPAISNEKLNQDDA